MRALVSAVSVHQNSIFGSRVRPKKEGHAGWAAGQQAPRVSTKLRNGGLLGGVTDVLDEDA